MTQGRFFAIMNIFKMKRNPGWRCFRFFRFSTRMLIWVYCLLIFNMVFDTNSNREKLAGWIKKVLIIDIVIYIFLLVLFPNLWNIGYIFAVITVGTIVSYLMYGELLKHDDNHLIKLAEVLGTVDITLNAIFCIIICTAMMVGILTAAGIRLLQP